MAQKPENKDRLITKWIRWWRDERGVSAVEFALITPILLTMFLSVSDYALAAYHKIELASATRAGAQYALLDPSSTLDTATILSVVQNATFLDPANLTVTVNETCGGSCTTGSGPRYAEITASYKNTWIFLPGSSTTLTNKSIVRVQ